MQQSLLRTPSSAGTIRSRNVSNRRCFGHEVVCRAASGAPNDVSMVKQGSKEMPISKRQLMQLALLLPIAQPAIAAPAGETPPGSPSLDGVVTVIPSSAVATLTPSEKQVYSLNLRVQAQNRAPDNFPGFVRSGFDVKVVGDGYSSTSNGLIYKDFREGNGVTPVDGQEVVFQYTGYNESASIIDTSYRQGRPAQTRLGITGLIPGFEEGIRGMKVGGQRRIVIPPALGPPVGPSTFFSAKQCEVFDIELLAIRQCERRQMAMFSDVVCTDIKQ